MRIYTFLQFCVPRHTWARGSPAELQAVGFDLPETCAPGLRSAPYCSFAYPGTPGQGVRLQNCRLWASTCERRARPGSGLRLSAVLHAQAPLGKGLPCRTAGCGSRPPGDPRNRAHEQRPFGARAVSQLGRPPATARQERWRSARGFAQRLMRLVQEPGFGRQIKLGAEPWV
jgi:hypothetical protein